MINFFNLNKISVGVCISGHLDYKIRGPKRTKMIFENHDEIKDFLYNDSEKNFQQYEPEIGYKYLKKFLSKYNLDYYIHTWSVNKKKDILETYNPKKFLCEKQIFFPFELDAYGINEKESNINNWKISSNAKLGFKYWWESRKKENQNISFNEFLNEIRIQIFRTTSRYYSLSKSIDLALSDKQGYEYYLVTRFGTNFSFFWNFNTTKLKKKTIYCEKRLNRIDEKISVNDMWFLTDSYGLEILKKIYQERFDYCTRPPFAFKEHFDKYKIDIELIDPPNKIEKLKIKLLY